MGRSRWWWTGAAMAAWACTGCLLLQYGTLTSRRNQMKGTWVYDSASTSTLDCSDGSRSISSILDDKVRLDTVNTDSDLQWLITTDNACPLPLTEVQGRAFVQDQFECTASTAFTSLTITPSEGEFRLNVKGDQLTQEKTVLEWRYLLGGLEVTCTETIEGTLRKQ